MNNPGYSLWSTKSSADPVDVALRYEADCVNLGNRWADHPTFHLQWDRVEAGFHTGATDARLRTPDMLPTHFFEFCTRHFLPEVWQALFSPASARLTQLTRSLNEETENLTGRSERWNKVRPRRVLARELTQSIRESCDVDADYEWLDTEAIELPL